MEETRALTLNELKKKAQDVAKTMVKVSLLQIPNNSNLPKELGLQFLESNFTEFDDNKKPALKDRCHVQSRFLIYPRSSSCQEEPIEIVCNCRLRKGWQRAIVTVYSIHHPEKKHVFTCELNDEGKLAATPLTPASI